MALHCLIWINRFNTNKSAFKLDSVKYLTLGDSNGLLVSIVNLKVLNTFKIHPNEPSWVQEMKKSFERHV